MATTGYQAGFSTNKLEMAHAEESAWGIPPTGVAYQKFRVQSESFRETKGWKTPPELRGMRRAARSVVTRIDGTGGLTAGLAFGNLDWALRNAFESTWTALSISDGGISADNATATLHAAAGTFGAVIVGQWIRVAGFSADGANGDFRVTAKAPDGSEITLHPAPATDANGGGDTIAVTGTMLRDGDTFSSDTVFKMASPTVGFAYPGTHFTGGSISAGLDDFATLSFDAIAMEEAKLTGPLGASQTAAPTTTVMDTVRNMKAVELIGNTEARLTSLQMSFQNSGAELQRALGSEKGVGVTEGEFGVTGQAEFYFKNHDVYDLYKDETVARLTFRTGDNAGNAMIFTLPSAVISDMTLTASGKGAYKAKANIMAQPDDATGCMAQIDALAAA